MQDGVLLGDGAGVVPVAVVAASSTTSRHRRCADPHGLPTIDELLRGYEETVPHFVEGAAADRMALHQRPGLGDA